MKKRIGQKIFIGITILICLILITFFVKDILIDLFKFQSQNNDAAISDLLNDHGIFGMLAIVFIQALQMVAVVIPCEFIQVSASVSFPWYIAILLLDFGVFIGASLIYMLVKTFKFDTNMFSKSNKKIRQLTLRDKKKNRTSQSLMFILLCTPIVPFGAACYYGASTKISYRRYILTAVLGVIPSILFSLCFGNLINYFVANEISIWYLVLIIAVLVIIIGCVVGFLLNRLFFKKNSGTPDSFMYVVLLKAIEFYVKLRVKPTFNRRKIKGLKGPYVLLSNHGSSLDVYYLSKLMHPRRMSFILNKYFFHFKYFRKILYTIGAIPKKLFSPDIETIYKTIKSIKEGYPILMCPEGRLSLSGASYYVSEETAKLLKKLKVPAVIALINGAYITNPKWRKKRIRGKVHTEVKYVISKDEIENLSVEEITALINKHMYYNEFEYARKHKLVYHYKKKMVGAEHVLYHCPKCHHEFNMISKGNKLICGSCGFEVEANVNYSFNENELGILDFNDYYQRISQIEEKNLLENDLDLSCEVDVRKFDFKNDKYGIKGKGICRLTKQGLTFKGIINKEEVEFEVPIKQLHALAFSVNEEFECYYEEDLYYFYPTSNRSQCTKWALIVDLLNKVGDNHE